VATLDDACDGMMRVSVVATGIDAVEGAQEPPAPRRTVADVVAEEARNNTTPSFESQRQPLVVEQPAPTPAAEPAPEPASRPDDTTSFSHSEPETGALNEAAPAPSPQFSPAPRRVETTDAVKQRLQDAVNRMPEDTPKPAAAAEGGRFAINSLIHRMTGGREEPYPERKEPSVNSGVDPDPVVEPEERDKAEIPAFLRRQAN